MRDIIATERRLGFREQQAEESGCGEAMPLAPKAQESPCCSLSAPMVSGAKALRPRATL